MFLVTKAVPIDRFEEFLVHHMSDNYVNTDIPSVEQCLRSAHNYHWVPISIGKG